jgi:hypothetical protein
VFVSSELDEARRETVGADLELDHGVGESAPPLGRASGVEDQHATVLGDLREMRVPVDNGVARGKSRHEPRFSVLARTAVVNDPDPSPTRLDHPLGRQHRAQRWLVHVSVHALHRAEAPQLLEDAQRDEVPGVEDQVSPREPLNAVVGQPAAAARHVRVGDDRDDQRAASGFFGSFGVPTANGTPTYVALRAGFISAEMRAP